MKFLIATDGSDFGKAATEKACELAAGVADVSFAIVSAYDTPASIAAEPYVGTPEMYQELSDGLKLIAEKAAGDARAIVERHFPGSSVETVVAMGRAVEVILEAAEKAGADVIVVGSHGHGFWGRSLLGSVSDGVVHHADRPVLVVRK
jgi:nucleotide-binding universal stress UspA family protein